MAMTQKYEEHVREQQAQVEKEDFSDMVAEHAAKQKQRNGKLSPRTAVVAARNIKSSNFRPLSYTWPSLKPFAWTSGLLHTWARRTSSPAIPKALSFSGSYFRPVL